MILNSMHVFVKSNCCYIIIRFLTWLTQLVLSIVSETNIETVFVRLV